MDKKFNFEEKLDFHDIDLTQPDKVIEMILSQLPEATNGIILGKIQRYDGHVFPYTQMGLSGITNILGASEKTIDIQKNLGEIGYEDHKFECFLYTPEYESYKYRVFFVKYGIAHYPVKIILDESIAKSISDSSSGYIYTCDSREDLESLVYNIFNSKRVVTVMQELIRINQAKKYEKDNLKTNNSDKIE